MYIVKYEWLSSSPNSDSIERVTVSVEVVFHLFRRLKFAQLLGELGANSSSESEGPVVGMP